MKNKKSIYVLLPIVLLIWGLVIYRFFDFSTDDIPDGTTSNFTVKPLAVMPRDTFNINVNYRDPFLGKMYLPRQVKKSGRKTNSIEQAAPLVWPSIVYRGLVSDAKNKKKVFMLIISGQTFLMSERDTELDVQIKGGNREHITVTFQGVPNKIFLQP